MLRENGLKLKLSEDQTVFGLFCSLPSPIAVEMIGCAGFDFVIIDTEHVLVNPETLENMIRAAEAIGITPLVRVMGVNPKEILRALDGGAQGIVVPSVESADQARQAVAACRYYPEGARSLNMGRPGAFGREDPLAYISRANQEIMVVPMIESRLGIEHSDEILSVPGVDMVLEGAADLSQSCGVPWDIQSSIVREELIRLFAAAERTGVPFCALPRALEEVTLWRERGVRAFVLGDERGIAFRAIRGQLDRYKDTLRKGDKDE
jgi:2-keto-3-deoxy-L-rhamnonate aldolase RhmA